jgi:hypothetical protein
MSKIALSGSPTGTGVFTIESPSSNTSRTLVLPDEAGTVLTSASDLAQKGVPAFSAYVNGPQVISNYTYTKIKFNAELFDTHGFFNSSTYVFQPTIAGYYVINGNVNLYYASSSSHAGIISLYKNGSTYKAGNIATGFSGFYPNSTVTSLVYFNGSTDYIEMYALFNYAVGTTPTVGGDGPFRSEFSGLLVRAD